MRPRLALAAVVIALAAAGVPISAAGGGIENDAVCEYVELGPPGALANELQITTQDYVGEIAVYRKGNRLVVSTNGSEEVRCTGPEFPTVTNVDRVYVRVVRESLDVLILDLGGGVLAPGATDEPDGTSEIEVSLEEAAGTVLGVFGTATDDHVELGSIAPGSYGVNLNAGKEESPDVDVTGENAYVFVALGAGIDRVDSRGLTDFSTGPFSFDFAAHGGRAADVLIGNDRKNVLSGAKGSDRLVGDGLGDRLYGGAGADRIEARDRHRDLVFCGPGADTARADPADRRHRCE